MEENDIDEEFPRPLALGPSTKGEVLRAATVNKLKNLPGTAEAKQQYLNPNAAATDALISRLSKAALEMQANQEITTSGLANAAGQRFIMAKRVSDEFDPSSSINQGKLFTAGELSESNPLNYKQVINNLLGFKDMAAKAAADVWSTPNGKAAEFYLKQVSPGALEAYERLTKFNSLQQQIKDIHTSQAAGNITPSQGLQQILGLRQEMDKVKPTPQDEILLKSQPLTETIYDPYSKKFVDNVNRLTNAELIAEGKKHIQLSKDVAQGITDIAGSTTYNPVRASHDPGYDIPGAVADVGKMVVDLPTHVKGSIGNLIDPNAERPGSWADNAAKEADALTAKRNAEMNPTQAASQVIPLPKVLSDTGALTRGDIKDTSSSLGFSLVSMGATGLTGAAGSAAGSPVAGVLAGMAASGTAAYRMDKGMVTRQLINATEAAIGRPMTADERTALLDKTDAARSNHALWEAGPEAIGNAVEMFGLGKIFHGASKGLAKQVAGYLTSNLGMELGTETITQMGQNNAEHAMGIGDGERKDWGKLSDWGKALKEVAPAVIVQGGVTHGATAAAGAFAGSDIGMGQAAVEARDAAIPADQPTSGSAKGTLDSLADKAISAVKTMAAGKSEEQKKTDAMVNSRSSVNYKTNLEEAVKTGNIADYIDPNNEKYDPILAVDVLQKRNATEGTSEQEKIDNHNKALDIQGGINQGIVDKTVAAGELYQKIKNKSASKEETAQYSALTDTIKNLHSMNATVEAAVTAMTPIATTPESLKTSIETAANATDSATIDKSLTDILVNNGGADSHSFGSSLDAIQSNPKASPEAKNMAAQLQKLAKAKDQHQELIDKNPDDVHTDIMAGGQGYKGINTYQQNIARALKAGNIALAQRELKGLMKIAAEQRMKADTLRNATNAVANKTALSDEDTANLEILNGRRGKKGPYKPNPLAPKWLATVDLMHSEAEALAQAVEVAKGQFALKKADSGIAPQAAKVAPTQPASKPKPIPAPSQKESVITAKPNVEMKSRAREVLKAMQIPGSVDVNSTAIGILHQAGALNPQTIQNLLEVTPEVAKDIHAQLSGEKIIQKKTEPSSTTEKKQSTTQAAADTVAPSSEENKGTAKVETKEPIRDTPPIEAYNESEIDPGEEPITSHLRDTKSDSSHKTEPVRQKVTEEVPSEPTYTDAELESISVSFSPGFLDGVPPINAKQALDIISKDMEIYEKIFKCVGV